MIEFMAGQHDFVDWHTLPNVVHQDLSMADTP